MIVEIYELSSVHGGVCLSDCKHHIEVIESSNVCKMRDLGVIPKRGLDLYLYSMESLGFGPMISGLKDALRRYDCLFSCHIIDYQGSLDIALEQYVVLTCLKNNAAIIC